MCVRKISGSVEMWGPTCSSLLQSQIFYVYRPRPPAFRYVPIVRGSGVSEQGVPLFAGLSGGGGRRRWRPGLRAGDAVAFPSKHLWHRVAETTRGLRQTFVFWARRPDAEPDCESDGE